MSVDPVLSPDVTKLWQKEFDSLDTAPGWAAFRSGLTNMLRFCVTITDEDDDLLRLLLDPTGRGFVRAIEFGEILRLFGPLPRLFSLVRRVMAEKWFCGRFNSHDAILALTRQPPGTFLVTIAGAGAFGLFFVWTNGKVLPVRVRGSFDRGLLIDDTDGERSFETIFDVLTHYKKWLYYPFSASLRREPWYHGTITKEEATGRLKERRQGTFVIGSSEKEDEYICSYVGADSAVQHELVCAPASGIVPLEKRASVLVRLLQVVDTNRQLLRYPYPGGVAKFLVGPLSRRVLDTLRLSDDPYEPTEVTSSAAAATSISTYPRNGNGGYNLICDSFLVQRFENWTILSVADGCNWGHRPREAAMRASSAIADYMLGQTKDVVDSLDIAHTLLRGFSVAHSKIVEGKPEILEAGTTTLLAGVIAELQDTDVRDGNTHGFVCASVGDCKAFVWRPAADKVIDVTARNRGGLNATDPGGRLGPYLDGGQPDLRNLRTHFEFCREGDVILLMSDGVHDNLDPQSLGHDPSDIGLQETTWAQVSPAAYERAKDQFLCELLKALLKSCATPRQAVDALIRYCVSVTKSCREFMEANPKAKQPVDYKLYPGKMDHTTCVAVTVPPRGQAQ